MSIANFFKQIASKRRAKNAKIKELENQLHLIKSDKNRLINEVRRLKQEVSNLKARNLSLQAQVQMLEGKLHRERNNLGQFTKKN